MAASRPYGRCAVGPCPSLDPTTAPTRQPQQKKIRKKMGAGLDVSGATDKQGSRLVRRAAVEAVQRVPAHTRLGQRRDQVAARRGHNIGVVAAARDLTGLVFYGLRDHRIRSLPSRPAAA